MELLFGRSSNDWNINKFMIRKKGTTKSKMVKVNPSNVWECKSCKESAVSKYAQAGLQTNPKCPKCGHPMGLVGISV